MDICNIFKQWLCLGVIVCIASVTGFAQCNFDTIVSDAQTCSTAEFLCGYVMDGFEGELSAAETPGIQPENFCGTSSAENIRWYSFSTCEENVTIEIIHTSCSGGILPTQGFQAGIYSSCDFENDFLTCETSQAVNGMVNLSFVSPPGIHYLFVDGFAGSVCDYEINVVAGINTTPIDSTTYIGSDVSASTDTLDCGLIEGPNGIGDQEVCSLGAATFTVVTSSGTFSSDLLVVDLDSLFCIDPPLESEFADDFFCLTWHVDPSVGYNLLSDTVYQIPYGEWGPADYPLIVEWTSLGTYDISYSIQSNPNIPSCLGLGFGIDCGSTSITVEVIGPTIISLPSDTICEGDSYFFCGQLFFESGLLTCENLQTCEIEQQPLFVIPRIEKQLGTKYVCANDCFEVYGNQFCTPGNYSVGGASNCDTFFLFTITELTLDLDIVGDTVITCTSTAATLSLTLTTNFTDNVGIVWTGPQNQPITANSDGTLTATEPGVYTVTATPADLSGCSQTATVTVLKDDAVPVLMASDQTITCAQPAVVLILSSSEPIAAYDWVGPSGYTSTEIAPTATDPGTYTAEVIAENGCTAQTSLTVAADIDPPTATLSFVNLDCEVRSGEASFSSATATSQQWTDPSGTTTTTPTLNYTSAGTYLLTLERANGCMLDTSFTVIDLSYSPSLELPADTLWRCSTVQISYPVSITPQWQVAWTTPDGIAEVVEETLLALQPGTYYASISDTTLGCTAIDTVVIDLDTDTLSADFMLLDPSCFGFSDGSLGLDILAGQPPFTLQLNDAPAEKADLLQLPVGSYNIQITDAYGCLIDTLLELADPTEVLITSPDILNIKYEPNVALSIEHNLEADELGSVQWFDTSVGLVHTGNPYELEAIDVLPEYGILVTNNEGCTDSASVLIEFDYSIDTHVPNIFSPNGDGTNDRWFISSSGFPSTITQVAVYDRWGNTMYTGSNITYNEEEQGWDGRANGRLCLPGVYMYTMTYTQADGNQVTKAGSLTLIR